MVFTLHVRILNGIALSVAISFAINGLSTISTSQLGTMAVLDVIPHAIRLLAGD
jgi:hypothetical protein